MKLQVDPHNRLVVSETGKKLPLTRFRRVFDGSFKTGPNGTLIYHIKGPMYGLEAERKAPHQVKLRGKWSLSKNYDLVLTLDKWRRQVPGDELTLQGQIVAANANSISFALTSRSEKNIESRNILKLQGVWQADKHNRLTFRVRKAQGIYDTLIFDGIWEVDKKHRIVYRYEKVQLIRKRRLKKSIIFEGHWDIARRNRLSYEISREGKSAFGFRTDIGVLAKNYIKYKVGIGVRNRKEPIERIITLYGQWKIKKNVGLLFEIEYEKGKAKAIIFGADAKLTKRNELKFKLKNEYGKDLGLELKLSQKLLPGDGQAFLKLLRSKKEASVYVGAAWRW
ncbi:MAG: hypothetical protein ISS43_00390 [Candidatus Omnitrophica bacterium]|nr:hypothetical protein [Candidatus Omnitrophota bacterium]